jgi:hypothetical protein
MSPFSFIRWKSVFTHRGWSVGECPACQGIEVLRVEEQESIYTILSVWKIRKSRGWFARCDFCGRFVPGGNVTSGVGLERWSHSDGLAELPRLLEYRGKIAPMSPSSDARLRSLLASVTSATRLNEMNIAVGLALGAVGGTALGIGLGVELQRAQLWSTNTDAFGFGMVGGMLGALGGAIVGSIAYWLVRRGAVARGRLAEKVSLYPIDLDRLAALAVAFPAHIQRAAADVRNSLH